jgi:Mg2+ and Co2+ transporter CorA
MSQSNFETALINVLQSSYDIEQPYTVAGREFSFYGKFDQRNAKYLMSKQFEYYSFSVYDHLFYKEVDTVTENFLLDLKTLTEEVVDIYSKVDGEHMETSMTYIIKSNQDLSPEVNKVLKKKANFIKNFSMGLKGWSKMKVIVMVPTSNEVYVNKFGNRDKASFQKVLNTILNP